MNPFKTKKRLPFKIWNKIKYVEFSEIRKFHGKEWYKKWAKDFGSGQTCPIIEDGKTGLSCYYHDYINSADKIDYNTNYLWD